MKGNKLNGSADLSAKAIRQVFEETANNNKKDIQKAETNLSQNKKVIDGQSVACTQ